MKEPHSREDLVLPQADDIPHKGNKRLFCMPTD